MEILIGMVVLLIGILAIARIFPAGFLSIQRTGDYTVGQSLAKLQLTDMENQVALPEGILATIQDASGAIKPVSNISPDDLSDVGPATLPAGVPNGVDPYYYSNINRKRFIKGEPVRLPVATPNAVTGQYGAIYMLQFGPVFNAFGTSAFPSDSIKVYGAEMERILQGAIATVDNNDTTPRIINDTQYTIDYQNQMIAFFPRVKNGRAIPYRDFQIQIDYYINDGGRIVVTPISTNIRVDDVDPPLSGEALRPVWRSIWYNQEDQDRNIQKDFTKPKPTDFDDTLSFRKEGEEVSRRFRLVSSTPVQTSGTAPTWSDDSYEYAWYSQQWANNANGGVLLFNPLGRTTTFRTSTGNQPLTARVDYLTFDNHIIREDRAVPTRAPFELKLSLPNLLTQGELQEDQTAYNGMFRDPGNTATPAVLIFNKATGEQIDAFTGTCTGGVGAGRNFSINIRTGTIRLNEAFVNANNLQSANIRIYYRAAKQWGMQVQKAYAKYSAVTTSASVDYKSYFAPTTGSRVYFAISETGKSVLLGEYYVKTTGGEVKHFNNETYQLSPDKTQYENGLPYLDLKDLHPEAGSEGWSFNSDVTGRALSNVQGLSLKSRVIWLDSSSTIKDSAGNSVLLNHWKHNDTDTLLTNVAGR